MHHCVTFLSKRLVLIFTAAGLASSIALKAQSFAASGPAATTPPSTASTAKTTPWHETSAPEKLISADVHDGYITVDGLVMKAQLNYGIHKAGYMYFFIPGTGTAIVSLVPMTNAVHVKNAFHGSMLEFPVAGHTVALENEGNLMGPGKTDAYVWLDTKTVAIDRYPMMGFGMTTQAPYEWPYSAPMDKNGPNSSKLAPRLPASMLPRVKPEPAMSVAVASGR